MREEVDILKHLSQASLTQYVDGRHPNVLAYIDSWEEDEALFIRTELCESGNLARFLWEYGRVFPRLDEARVWKIIVDLSNVCHAINLFFGSPIHRGCQADHIPSFLCFFSFFVGLEIYPRFWGDPPGLEAVERIRDQGRKVQDW